jgi:hypothetical protein
LESIDKKNRYLWGIGLIVLIAKRLLFFVLPILIFVFVLYELVFDIDMKFLWPRLLIYTILIGLVTLRNYKYKSVEEPVESIGYLEDKISAGRWEMVENGESTFMLRPKFDFPYNLLSKDKVHVRYSDGIVSIEGPEYYVVNLVRDISGKRNPWISKITSIVFLILILIILSLPILLETGIIADLRINYHNYQARNVNKIVIQDANALGNTENNTNNYGFGAEYNDYIFYVENHLKLVRTNKDFQDKAYLIEKSSGTGISRLNIVDDWIFYSSGKTLSRMRIDGANNETIYKMGYLIDIHVLGNYVYFINPSDKFTVYRMDVNGQNLEKFINLPVHSIAIYDNRLFYSYGDEGEGFIESVDIEGKDKRTEMEIPVNDFIRWDDHYYFLGHDDYRLYRYEIGGGGDPQLLVDGRVSSYIVTDYGIYYSLHSYDVGYPGEGLYKIGLDGTGNILLYDTQRVEGLIQVGNWILFMSYDENMYPSQKRLELWSDEITVMD